MSHPLCRAPATGRTGPAWQRLYGRLTTNDRFENLAPRD